METKNRRRAFTLIELLVVAGIVAAIAIVVLVNLQGDKNSSDVTGVAQQAVALLRQAQTNAASQKNDSAWGVYFSNATNTEPFYAIISSSTYSPSTVIAQYPLPSTVAFVTSTLSKGSSLTVAFNPISGASSVSTTLSIYSVENPSFVESIAINGLGQVGYGNTNTSNNNCVDDALGNWQLSTALPTFIEYTNLVTYNGYVYSMGGFADGSGESGGSTSTVYYAPITSTGAIGSWSTTTALPGPIYDGSIIVNNGYVYSLGGTPDASWDATSTVYYAQISNSTGAIGPWQMTTSLPSTLAFMGTIVNNGYIYLMGGENSAATKLSTVYYAQISSSTGAIGPWVPTMSLPTDAGTLTVTNDGYVYAIGGGGESSATSTVYYAQISSSTGAIGSWVPTTALPNVFGEPQSSAAVVNGRYIYVLNSDTNNVPPLYSALINGDGTLGSWQSPATTSQIFYVLEGLLGSTQYMYLFIGSSNFLHPTSTGFYIPLCN